MAIRLELADYPVKSVKFGKQTKYNNGALDINQEEVLSLILKDKRIVSADLELAFPNEKTRIANVRDVVEPRVKVSGPGANFPGILGPSDTTGEGRTNRLSGVAVVASAQYKPTILSGLTAPTCGIIDMWGQGTNVPPYGKLDDVVLVLKLVDPITEYEAQEAILSAELKVAVHLAETTKDKEPQNVEVFELPDVDPTLPRVVYVCSCACDAYSPHSGVAFYGLSIKDSLPTLVHPNEFIDGAVTSDARRGMGTRITTWQWQNQPVIMQLMKEHGKRLNFLGVILERTEIASLLGKRIQAASTAQMARLMRADGAIITKTTTSGNGFIEVMLTVHECEKKGVKTLLITAEYGGKDGAELPLVYYAPEATAMVSLGSFERGVTVGVPDKVIGLEPGKLTSLNPTDPAFSPWSELTLETYNLTSGIDWFGETYYTCKQY